MRGKQAQTGSVIVFVALMLPFLILFAGMAIDIGRAYLYKSHMQNAADAAALAGIAAAGGQKARLITVKDVPAMGAYIKTETTAKADAGANKILSMDTDGNWANNGSIVSTELRKEINPAKKSPLLKNRAIKYYYKVELADGFPFQFASSFLPQSLLPSSWSVHAEAWAEAENDPLAGIDLLTQMKENEEAYTYSTFQDLQAHFKGYSYSDIKAISFTNKGTAHRQDGTRNEIFDLDGTNSINNDMNSLLVNFKPDFTSANQFQDNWDLDKLDNMTPAEARSYLWDIMGIKLINWRIIDNNGTVLEEKEGGATYWGQVYDKLKAKFGESIATQLVFSRIESIINVTNPYEVRDVENYPEDEVSYDVNTDKPNKLDPLFVRIESEEYNTKGELGYVMNTTRDITINIQADNTALKDDGTTYKYRPMIFFYEGPVDQNGQMGGERKSRTVTLNFEADFRGILFAPNSPVYIKGNNHKFTGIVIAESFVQFNNMTNTYEEIPTPNVYSAADIDDFQNFYSQLGLSDATYDTFGLTHLVVYTDPMKDVIFNTIRSSGTI